MISRLMAVPAHQNLPSMLGHPADRAQNPTATSIDQIITPVCPVHLCRPVHGLPNDPFRMV